MQTTASETIEQEAPIVKYVVKRDGSRQPVNLDKIRARFVNKGQGLNLDYINFDVIVGKVASGIYQGKIIIPFTFPADILICSEAHITYLPIIPEY